MTHEMTRGYLQGTRSSGPNEACLWLDDRAVCGGDDEPR